jgi:hypothetical protein
VLRGTQVPAQGRRSRFAYGALTRSGRPSRPFGYAPIFYTLEATAAASRGSYNPRRATPAGLTRVGFGLFPVRSPLLGESRLISLPRGTKMFQFPRLPLPTLWIQVGVTEHDLRRVAPFGNPRINAC